VEVERVLDTNIHRLEAMSLVQKHLLGNPALSGKDVQLDAYLDHLTSELLINLFPNENDPEVTRDFDTLFLDYDKAMRIAIVLNELVCNAIEHGLAGVEKPALKISLKHRGNELVLTVRDNGPGLPEGLLLQKSVKGRNLVVKILHPVDGKITYSNENGCVATVILELNEKSQGSR